MKLTKQKFSLSNRNVLLAAAAIVLIFAFLILGRAGFLAVAAIMLFFIIVPYSLLRVLSLDEDEKLFFGLFISLGIFPILVWFVGRIIPSFRVSLIVTLIIIAAAAFVLEKKGELFRKPDLHAEAKSEPEEAVSPVESKQ
jgi:hypothetical protein